MKKTDHIQTFDLQEFLNAIFFKHRKTAFEHNIALSLTGDLAASLLITADKERIRHLMNAVLLHAIQHSGASDVHFSARPLLRCGDDILIEFLVTDNGEPQKSAGRFTYYRSLIQIRMLIEALNGKSEWVLSPIHGNSLKFVLKCLWKDYAHSATADFSSHTAALQTKQVLIVEDNEINQKTITDILQKERITYRVAGNGKEAIDVMEEEAFDLILMDLQMPYMDGFETTCYLRRQLKSEVPIMGMTTSEGGEDTLRCLHAGMNRFIQKPFTPETLLMHICSFFEDESAACAQLPHSRS